MSIHKRRDGRYTVPVPMTKDEIYDALAELITSELIREGELVSAVDCKRYLTLKLARREREIFAVIYMDSQHRIISYEEPFKGTIDSASIYPREVAKRALQLNAGAVIFSHNHPSGSTTPSQADHQITARLRDALALIGVRVLDHVIIGGAETYSFAERGDL